MKKLITFKLLLIITSLILGTFVSVRQTHGVTNLRSEEDSLLSREEIINQDYFSAGNTVMASGTVNGDAYLAGGTVIVNGIINGDVLVAGGNISITGTVNGNVRSAGGQVSISGQVAKNVTAVGGSVTIQEPGSVGGSIVGAAGMLALFAPVEKGATLAGSQVSINSSIGGSVTSAAETLTLSPHAQIYGNLNYWSDQKATIATEAAVKDQVVFHKTDWKKDQAKQTKEKASQALSKFAISMAVISLLGSFLLGLLLRRYLPVFIENVSTTVLSKPLESLGIGSLVLMLMPVVSIFLLVSIIGIPIFIALIMAVIMLAMLNDIFIAFALAKKFLQQYRTWGFLATLVAIGLIKLIPVVGWLIGLVAYIFGLGAILITKKQMYVSLRQKELI